MADSLVLSGVRQVTKHTGQEMTRLDDPRGGNTWQIKRWWVKAKTAVYTPCTVFQVTGSGDSCYLAVEAKKHVNLRIIHDGAFGFKFADANEVERVALFTSNWELIEHYVFPRLSGGKIMTVVPADGAGKPTPAPPATTIGDLTITSSDASVVEGAVVTFSVSNSGTSSGLSYSWSIASGNGTIEGSATGSSVAVLANAAGPLSVSCTVMSSDPGNTDSPQSATSAEVTVTESVATRIAGATYSYTVGVNNGLYTLDGVDSPDLTGSVGESFVFDYSAVASEHPLIIYTDSSKTTPVTVGVTVQGDVLLFEPPIAGTFSYQCANHANMGGDIIVTD